MRLFIVALSAAAVVATAASAQPAAAPLAQDTKCLLDMVALSNSTDAQAQRAGEDGVLFFTGRISAHSPGFDFTRLKALAANMSPQAVQTDLQQTCGPLVQRYMRALETALTPPAGTPAPTPPAQ